MLADPNTAAHQPRLERVVAGSAAGDVAAGEGDLAGIVPFFFFLFFFFFFFSFDFIARLAARARIPIFSYTAPAPSPDGLRLAWISDVDGRPRAWLADLSNRPAPSEGARPAASLRPPFRRHGSCFSRGRPDGAWIALPGGSARRRTHRGAPRQSPDSTGEVRDLAPGAAAATLGAWAPTGRVVGLTVFHPRAAATARPASSTSATARPRCSPPVPPRGCARCRATVGAPSSGWVAAAPATWSWSTCAPGGAPS